MQLQALAFLLQPVSNNWLVSSVFHFTNLANLSCSKTASISSIKESLQSSSSGVTAYVLHGERKSDRQKQLRNSGCRKIINRYYYCIHLLNHSNEVLIRLGQLILFIRSQLNSSEIQDSSIVATHLYQRWSIISPDCYPVAKYDFLHQELRYRQLFF